MIAVDTNILVYGHREDNPWFEAAWDCIERLAEGKAQWAIPWPCLHEFVAVVTHPRVFSPPTPVDRALDQAAAWLESPSVVLLGEGPGYWDALATLVVRGGVVGSMVHDARIAALCETHGVEELWSADRDFSRFPGLRVRNPLVDARAG